MLHLVTVAGESPGDYHTLQPGTRTEQLPTHIRERDLCGLDPQPKRGQRQRAEVVIEQPGAVGKTGIAIADQTMKSRTITGPSGFGEGINRRSDEVEPRTHRRRRSRLDRRRSWRPGSRAGSQHERQRSQRQAPRSGADAG